MTGGGGALKLSPGAGGPSAALRRPFHKQDTWRTHGLIPAGGRFSPVRDKGCPHSSATTKPGRSDEVPASIVDHAQPHPKRGANPGRSGTDVRSLGGRPGRRRQKRVGRKGRPGLPAFRVTLAATKRGGRTSEDEACPPASQRRAGVCPPGRDALADAQVPCRVDGAEAELCTCWFCVMSLTMPRAPP